MKDFLGRELKFGDKVVHYLRDRYGSTMTPRLCVVTEVHENRVKCVKDTKYDWERKVSWFYTPDYLVKVSDAA